MTATALFRQIESLPEDLRQEVADFVAFLKFKRLGIWTTDDFTQEECDEFERRWAEYEADPSTGTDAFEAMKNIRASHAIWPRFRQRSTLGNPRSLQLVRKNLGRNLR